MSLIDTTHNVIFNKGLRLGDTNIKGNETEIEDERIASVEIADKVIVKVVSKSEEESTKRIPSKYIYSCLPTTPTPTTHTQCFGTISYRSKSSTTAPIHSYSILNNVVKICK
jgi:hypothetical protein